MKKITILHVLFAMTVMACLVGCNGQVALTGKVTYTDGSPVQVGQVVFSDENYGFRGPIDKNGHYKLGGNYEGDGIRPGKYNVYLVETVTMAPDENGHPKMTTHVALKYTDPKTSELTCEVKGKMTFDFTVEKP